MIRKNYSDPIAASTKNMHIVIMVICSIMFVVYVIVLDVVAIYNRNFEVSANIFYRPNQHNSEAYSNAFVIGYTIPLLILIYDLASVVYAVIVLIFLLCGHYITCKCECLSKNLPSKMPV